MKIKNSVVNGTIRAIKCWKGVLLIWFFYLLSVSLLAISVKGSLISGYGKSMIVERFSNGLNIEVLADLGSGLRSLFSSFTYGFFFLILTGFILNAFLTGGLFSNLKGSSARFSSSEFFRAAALNFWSFLIIITVAIFIIIFLIIFILVIPLMIAVRAEPYSEKILFNTAVICGSLLVFLILMILLVTDYARAWQAVYINPACFRAIGFGFRQTFITFKSSYPMVLIITIITGLFWWLVLKIVPAWRPSTGGGILILFLVSQFLFFVKIMLKTWRYACVTSLLEQTFNYPIPDLVNSH